MGGLILLVFFLGAGVLLGWIAFFRSLSQGGEIASLREEVKALRKALAARTPAAPQTEASAEPIQTAGGQEPAHEAQNEEPGAAAPLSSETVPAAASDDAANAAHEEAAPAPQEEIREGADQPAPEPELVQEPAAAADAASMHENPESGASGWALAGNWLVWMGGATLALGGAFLVKSAIDAGFFGPGMRIMLALVAGAAMIVVGEWARRERLEFEEDEAPRTPLTDSAAPPVLAGAGGATLYGAIYAAYGLYDMLPGVVAFILLALACAGMVVLAVMHRAPAVAGLGLAGAYISPLLTASGDPAANALFVYIFGVSAAGLMVARVMSWRVIAYLALIGGYVWPCLWIVFAGAPALALYVYLPAYLALAGAVAWDEAGEPLNLKLIRDAGADALPVSLLAFFIAAIASLVLANALTLAHPGADALIPMWAAFALMTLFASSRREAFSLSAVFVLLAFLATTYLAPNTHIIAALAVTAVFALIFTGGAYAASLAQKQKGPLSVIAAFAPALLLAVQFHEREPDASLLWSLAALFLAVVNVVMIADLRRRAGRFDACPGAVSSFVVGATFASSLALVIAFEGLVLSAALAVQAPVMILLWRRYRLPALKYCAAGLAMLSSARLLLLPDVFAAELGGLPLLNLLIPCYLIPAAGFWASARWLEKGGLAPSARVIQSLEGGAIALFAAFVSLQVRHLFNDGAVPAGRFTLLEASLQIANWVSISAFLRWRFEDALTLVRRIAELALIGLSAVMAVVLLLGVFNPWWGYDNPLIEGPPVFNLLIVAYLIPALAFCAAAWAARRSGAFLQSRIAGLAAGILGGVWMALTIRHGFHAPDLSDGRPVLAEISLQIMSWLAAAAFLGWRFTGPSRNAVRIAESILLLFAGWAFFMFSFVVYNPWWGMGPRISWPPVINLLLLAYFAPAAGFGAVSFAARRRGGLDEARITGLLAAFIGYVWIVLSIRHLFQAPDLSGASIGDAETWSYSIATILYAAGLLVAGALRRSAILRFAGFAALMLAVLKVFLFDMAGLDGIWRASSFLGLGAALIGIAMLYQHLASIEKLSKEEA